ncbi:hypothetical protein CLBKND_01678 [Methylorubrum aminovorans]
MVTTVVPGALPQSDGSRVKPAVAGQTPLQETASAVSASQGLRPVDPLQRPLPRPLGSVLGIKMTPGLREAVAYRARQDGLSDSAWLRHLVLRELGLNSETDAVSGPRPRIPPEEQAVLAGALRDLGALYEPLSRPAVPVAEVKAALDRVRAAVMPIVIGLNGRSA